jgi:hypothetical protein
VDAWQDKNIVWFLSMGVPLTGSITVQRRMKKKGRIDVRAPPIVEVYQKYMRGVDRADQQLSSFRPGSQTKRWWVVLAWHIINLAVHNAYIVARLNHEAAGTKSLTNSEFRLKLAHQLVNGWTCVKEAGRPRSVKGDVECHLVKLATEARCHVCGLASTGRKRVQTRYGCVTCGEHVCPTCYDVHRQKK